MCNTVGADLAEWLLRVQAEQATSQPNKTVWQKAIKQLGYTLGSLGVLIGVHVLEPGGSDMEAGGGEAFASLLATMMDAANFSLYL
jgi:hypothetical protein